jgi:predicted nuclease with TOPRIM domain
MIEPVAKQWRARVKGGAWDAWENGLYGQEVPPFMEIEERDLYPASALTALQEESARLQNEWDNCDEMLQAVRVSIVELRQENERLRVERYRLAYAITGGEDAPGLLDTVPVEELERIQRNNVASHNHDIDRATAAEARLAEAEKVIEPMLHGARIAEQNGYSDDNVLTINVAECRAARAFIEGRRHDG